MWNVVHGYILKLLHFVQYNIDFIACSLESGNIYNVI